MKNTGPMNKRQIMREVDHLTRPPRMEGKAKNRGMNPVRKPKSGKK